MKSTPNRILQAGVRLVRKEGLQTLTPTRVMSTAKISRPLFYVYFTDLTKYRHALMEYALLHEHYDVLVQGIVCYNVKFPGLPHRQRKEIEKVFSKLLEKKTLLRRAARPGILRG